ncbi:MAG TPA: hypothetical protein GX404_09735 [Syntrophomonadaceae bacterium]|nr:hypothetical protein [Syntrophomonadaceae bacterium]
MHTYYGDLHIHIGQARGRPVKITASRDLSLHKILYRDAPAKGLHLVGIVDAGSTLVSSEIARMLEKGLIQELPGGGFQANNGVLMITGCEIETRERVHVIAYLPTWQALQQWQAYVKSRVQNQELSTQKVQMDLGEVMDLCQELDGIFCPAHVFTPHKGIYGAYTRRLESVFGVQYREIQVLELGLSSDTDMADTIKETSHFTFLSNSDAHSAINIGREYNRLRMQEANFSELRLCLQHRQGRAVEGNYGLHPLLGKYYRSYCKACDTILDGEAVYRSCPYCNNTSIVMGVYDRIKELQDTRHSVHPPGRPPYYYRVPLSWLPGFGPVTCQRLLENYSEIDIIEELDIDIIRQKLPERLANVIEDMRQNRLTIIPGGGGRYGRVKTNHR